MSSSYALPSTHPATHNALRKIFTHIAELIRQPGGVNDNDAAICVLTDLRRLIAGLPLTTEQYAVAVARLDNAARYLLCGEVGAARFEFRLLVGGIADDVSVPAILLPAHVVDELRGDVDD